VLAALPDKWQPFFTFLAQTGLRISEALGLTWGDVELGVSPHVRVQYQLGRKGERTRLKTRHSRRTLPLSSGMAATLLELRARRYDGEGSPLWPNTRGGWLHRNNLDSRVLALVVEALGLDWVGFHSFRHTCASLLFANGKSIKQVQMWLGHADPGFTLRVYVHLMDDWAGRGRLPRPRHRGIPIGAPGAPSGGNQLLARYFQKNHPRILRESARHERFRLVPWLSA
jgi:integrase